MPRMVCVRITIILARSTFVLLLLRDASGVTHNADEALQRFHQVANAPINSIFNHQLGLGIVGGRLYQSDRVGKVAANVAIRILHGEPASSLSLVLTLVSRRKIDAMFKCENYSRGLPAD